VVVYGSKTWKEDLDLFSQEFDLPPPQVTVHVINPETVKNENEGWARETSLDLQMFHAMAPNASIHLVLSQSPALHHMMEAVRFIVPLVSVVSMSWGEPFDHLNFHRQFQSIFENQNTLFVASSGDDGSGCHYPASSSSIVAVGGTVGDKFLNEEWAWSGSGGGICVNGRPDYQNGLHNFSFRTTPDISILANPGVSIIFRQKLIHMSGTSVGAPLVAGILGGRIKNNKELYSLHSNHLRDIVTGSNQHFSAGPGFDLVTGLGSLINF